jgi:hypothetical protein
MNSKSDMQATKIIELRRMYVAVGLSFAMNITGNPTTITGNQLATVTPTHLLSLNSSLI